MNPSRQSGICSVVGFDVGRGMPVVDLWRTVVRFPGKNSTGNSGNMGHLIPTWHMKLFSSLRLS